MRSFEGTVWDPMLRRWVKPTPEVIERCASYPVEKRWVPRKAIEIRRPNPATGPPGNDYAARTPRGKEAHQNLMDTADALCQPSARTDRQKLEDQREFTTAVRRAIAAGVEDHPIVETWLRGQRSIGDYDQLTRSNRTRTRGTLTKLAAADFWIVFTAGELVPTKMERQKGWLSFRRILPLLLNRLESKDFPGPLFTREGRCWLVESDAELAKLREELRRRLNTKQNIHKRLQFLDLIKPPEKIKQRRRTFQRVRRGTPGGRGI